MMETKHHIRYGSVCSGVEAATLAWAPLGWECKFVSEVEPFPCAVLQQRFNATKPLRPLDPEEATNEKDRKMRESWLKQINKLPDTGTIPNLGDFTKIKGEDYVGAIDLLVGGTPCQDVSVAGKRAGFGEPQAKENAEKTRSGLAIDFVRLAYAARCKYFVLENVPGLFSSNKGRDFATLLSMFIGYDIEVPGGGWKNSGLARNRRSDRYGVAWRVLDAQFTRTPEFPFAVPQRRRRVFVVGCLGDWQRAATILLEPERMFWDTPTRIKTRQEVTGYTGTGSDCANEQNVSYTIAANYYKGVSTRQAASTLVFKNGKDVDQTHMQDKNNICFGIGRDAFNQGKNAKYGITLDENLQPPLTARGPGAISYKTLRRLLPVECERLMGFPDNHTRIKWNGNPVEKCPDAPRYKACGNSMCVNVMAWIGHRIQEVEERINNGEHK